MSRIALIAPTGMLGSAVYGVLKDRHDLTLILRDPKKIASLEQAYGSVKNHKIVAYNISDTQQDFLTGFTDARFSPSLMRLKEEIGDIDILVNAAGVIKPHSLKDPATTLFINGAFPHLLSSLFGGKLIQITTDCAFSGLDNVAPYTEDSIKDPNDLYGVSKSLGEPSDRSLVLRTSIIGPEISGFVSLIAWVQNQSGQTIKGFTRHLWNGITTKQFGKIVDEIVSHRNDYPNHGLFHVFSSDVTKFEMVNAIAKKFKVNVTVNPDDGPQLDRRLATVKDLCFKLKIPSFEKMLEDL